MSVITNIKKKATTNNNIDIIFLLLLIVFATLPIEKLNPKIIIVLFISQLSILLFGKKVKFKISVFLWMLLGLFTLNFLGLLYSENLSRGVTIITRQISIIIFPIFYIFYRVKKYGLLFVIYVVAIFSYILLSEIDIMYRFFYKSNIFPLDLDLFFSYRYTGAELTKILGIHNAYFGMFIVFSNVLIISFIERVKKNYHIVLLLALITFQSLFLLQMIAKTAIILNIIIVIPSLFYFFIKLRKRYIVFLLILLFLVIGWFSTSHLNLPLNRIKERFFELRSYENTTRETRMKIWKSALPIIQDNYLLGVGTGDVEKELHKEFAIHNMKSASNVHNQYLDYLMRFGIAGISLFLIVLGYALYNSMKKKNYIFFCFTLIIIGSCFTENILSRQLGLVFYASFNYLLYLYQPKKT